MTAPARTPLHQEPTIEEWQLVGGTLYEVSTLGRVRNEKGRVLRPRMHTNGYIRVSLKQGDKIRDHYVHRLVCRPFYGAPPSDDCHADHINGVRNDNRLSNLRWLLPDENRRLRNFARGEANANCKLKPSQVRYIRQKGYKRGQDQELASAFKVSREVIRDIRRGKTWRHIHD